MVMGIEMICKMGFTKILRIAITMTTITDAPKPSTLTPGRKLDSKNTISAVTIRLIKILIAICCLIRCFDCYPRIISGYQQRSEEHTSERQSRPQLVCRAQLEKKNDTDRHHIELRVWLGR